MIILQGMTYSIDFRRKVLDIRKAKGFTFKETANYFDVGVASIVRWSQRLTFQETRHKPATKINMQTLKEDITASPDIYHYERAARFQVSVSGIRHALKRLNVSYKKNLSTSQIHRRRTAYLSTES